MLTIWKAGAEIGDTVTVRIPAGARLLTIQVQHGSPCVWFLCDPSSPLVDRELAIHGTGHPIPPESAHSPYLGTFQLHGGALVLHAFDRGERQI